MIADLIEDVLAAMAITLVLAALIGSALVLSML